MYKLIRFSVVATILAASVAICSANEHLRAFQHAANGDFQGTTPTGSIHGRASIQGHYNDHDKVLTLTILAHSGNHRWDSRITFSGGAHRFDIHNSLPFDHQNIQTSSAFRSTGSGINVELSGTQLIGASGNGAVHGTLRLERLNGKYIFDLTIQEPHAKPHAKYYDFLFIGA